MDGSETRGGVSETGKTRATWQAIARFTAALLGGLSISLNLAPDRDNSLDRKLWTLTLMPAAQAVPARANLSLEAYPDEGYQQFVRRAEAMAQAEIDARFSRDITISRISLVAIGRNGGQSASLLSIDIDRTQWRRNPNITQYARYYPNSRTLLGLPLSGMNFAPPVLGTGDVQVTLRWTGRDDLDLAVSEPGGEVVFFGNPQLASGAALDVDANALCDIVTPVPIENIFWPTSTAPVGNYQAVVSLFARCDALTSAPIPFTLTISTNGTSQTYSSEVSGAESYRSYRFDVGTN
jgi:hypothetical protein